MTPVASSLCSLTSFSILLRNGRICRIIRLAPPRDAPPPFSPHARHPPEAAHLSTLDPDLHSQFLASISKFPADAFKKDVASPAPAAAIVPPSPDPSTPQTPNSNDSGHATVPSALHPRVAVILGVDRKWYLPLLICRALSTVPAAWWGLRCAFTFLAELLHIQAGMGHEGWTAAIVDGINQEWDVERRFRVTEVALAIMWVCMGIFGERFMGIEIPCNQRPRTRPSSRNSELTNTYSSAVHLLTFRISLLIV